MRKMKVMGMFLALAAFGGAMGVHASGDLFVAGVEQRNGRCTGVVKDASGMTVIGASVMAKGTTNGTVTDLDGSFSLDGVKPGDVIRITMWVIRTGKVFDHKHHLTATAVWEATSSNTRSMGINGQNIQVESVGWWNVDNALTRNASNSHSDGSMLSAVGRVIYNYDNRYIFTGTFRADGPYRDLISNLKLRASFGVIGNQDIAPYSTLALMSQTTTYFGNNTGVTGYWENTLATPDIKWEKTNQFDLGLDLSLWDNRLTFTFDYFDKWTADAILSTRLPYYLGGTSYLINAGEVSNRGFDFSISADVLRMEDLEWTTSVNGTYLKNKVVM